MRWFRINKRVFNSNIRPDSNEYKRKKCHEQVSLYIDIVFEREGVDFDCIGHIIYVDFYSGLRPLKSYMKLLFLVG